MLKFKTEPKKKQMEALIKMQGQAAFALLMDMGTGKTKTLIDNAVDLFTDGKIEAVLMLTLNGGQQNWIERELPKHTGVPYKAFISYGEMKAAQRKLWDAAAQKWDYTPDSLYFFCANIEMLGSVKGVKTIRTILDNYNTCFIIDESHRIKSPTGKWSKAAMSLAQFAPYRRIATGTSNPHSPLDLWSQFQFLHPSIMNARIFPIFKARYADIQKELLRSGAIKVDEASRRGADVRAVKLIPGRDYYDRINGYKNLDHLKKTIAPFTFSCRLSETTDMPPLTFSNHYVTSTVDQRRIYKQLVDYAAASTHDRMPDGLSGRDRIMWLVNNADVLPDNGLVKTLRLMQVATGFVKNDDGSIIEFDTNHYTDLIKLIEGMGEQQVIIFCNFLPEIARVAHHLDIEGISHVIYQGSTSADERTKAIDDFQGGAARVFLGQQATAGSMLTLTAGTQVIWFSLGNRAGDYIQANRRAWRIGQEHPVHVTHMLTQGTLHNTILKSIQERAERQDNIQYD